jgi:hypothetical protein
MKLRRIKGKQAGFTDLFLFMIVAFIVVIVAGVYIYMSVLVKDQLDDTQSPTGNVNYTEIVDDVYSPVVGAYKTLYWLSIFIIVAMVISIFIGSYFVTTRPVFFIPYIFIVIIAIVVSVGISNAYQTIAMDDTLSPVILGDGDEYAGFTGSNYIMWYLPIWIAVMGFAGGIVMFVRMKSEEYSPYG